MKALGEDAPYDALTPELILDGLDTNGWQTTGKLFPLNSYENRVYQVGVYEEDREFDVVVKFYRPGRWSKEQILEEHSFSFELVDDEIPVVPPLCRAKRSIFETGKFMFSVFDKVGGRAPNLEDDSVLRWMGRLIARTHLKGSIRRYDVRPQIDVQQFGFGPSRDVLASGYMPEGLSDVYDGLIQRALSEIQDRFSSRSDSQDIRLLGDCHIGNVLVSDDTMCFVDLDDSVMGPSIQDLWMLLSGDRESMQRQLREILKGYEQFRDFDYSEVPLIEPLRTLRMINYAGWLANRWNDPAFQTAFPWFSTQRYWEEHMNHIREQISAMDEPFSI